MGLSDRNDARLHRREPEREVAPVVLDEDPDEALERSEQRAMDDDGAVLPVVRPHVREPEANGHLVVELDRPHLPASAQDVRHVEIDLRPVERPLARRDHVLHVVPA